MKENLKGQVTHRVLTIGTKVFYDLVCRACLSIVLDEKEGCHHCNRANRPQIVTKPENLIEIPAVIKRGRGRPKGSKNKPKEA